MINEENEYIQYRFKTNSVFHIGAYVGEELDFYLQWGVKNIIFAEPNPELYSRLQENVKHENYKNINIITTDYAICDKITDSVDFYLYYNSCRDNMGCSSIKQSELHNQIYPQILDSGIIQVKTTTADSIIKDINFDVEFLNIDVQGAEYEVFLGADKLLSTTVKGVLVEVAKVELYKGQKFADDITNLLSKYGFRLEKYFSHADTWGDALFLKEGI